MCKTISWRPSKNPAPVIWHWHQEFSLFSADINLPWLLGDGVAWIVLTPFWDFSLEVSRATSDDHLQQWMQASLICIKPWICSLQEYHHFSGQVPRAKEQKASKALTSTWTMYPFPLKRTSIQSMPAPIKHTRSFVYSGLQRLCKNWTSQTAKRELHLHKLSLKWWLVIFLSLSVVLWVVNLDSLCLMLLGCELTYR